MFGYRGMDVVLLSETVSSKGVVPNANSKVSSRISGTENSSKRKRTGECNRPKHRLSSKSTLEAMNEEEIHTEERTRVSHSTRCLHWIWPVDYSTTQASTCPTSG
jgi:hypothetical protein